MTLLVLVPSHIEARVLSRALGPGGRLEICGIGPVSAALRCASLLRDLGPVPCLLLGVAGTRDPVLAPVGSVVRATALRNEAVGAGEGEGFIPLGEMGLDEPGLAPDLIEVLPASKMVPKAVEEALPPEDLPELLSGHMGMVATSSGTLELARARQRRYPDVLVEDLESHAVAQVALDAGAPLTVIRAVSNVAGDRDKTRWDLRGSLYALADLLAKSTAEPRP
ncbi:MAG: futalosine hydrolase [Pseudohongiellaceae bacterium]